MSEQEAIMEQLDAVQDIIHLHKCFYCQIATAQEAVVIIQDIPPEGCRIVVVGVCDTCGGDK
jgi:hypothetical protein